MAGRRARRRGCDPEACRVRIETGHGLRGQKQSEEKQNEPATTKAHLAFGAYLHRTEMCLISHPPCFTPANSIKPNLKSKAAFFQGSDAPSMGL